MMCTTIPATLLTFPLLLHKLAFACLFHGRARVWYPTKFEVVDNEIMEVQEDEIHLSID